MIVLIKVVSKILIDIVVSGYRRRCTVLFLFFGNNYVSVVKGEVPDSDVDFV